MKKHPSIVILLPLILILVFLGLIISAMTNGIYKHQSDILERAIDDIKQDVSHITRMAERTLHVAPQLLDDDLTQLGTDPRVSLAAVIHSNGEIISSTDFQLINKNVFNVIPEISHELFANTISQRTAIITQSERGHIIYAVMSFIDVTDNSVLRTSKKGIVFIRYDLSKLYTDVVWSVIKDRYIDIIAALIASIVIAMTLNRYLVRPLMSLQRGARQIAQGDYSNELIIDGAREVTDTLTAFNSMSNKIEANIQQIQTANKHTQAILDNVIDGIVTINKQGIIQSFNQSAENIFGYKAVDVIGRNVKVLMPEPYHHNHDQYLQHYMEGGQPKIIGKGREVVGLRKNGNTFPMDLAVTELRIENEVTFIGIVRDISERMKVDRMKNEFVSTISHELRTPLTAIHASLDLMGSGVIAEVPEKLVNLLDIAKRNTVRLHDLVNDLLDIEKLEAGQMNFDFAPHSTEQLINDSITLNQGFADKFHVRIEKSKDNVSGMVNVDARRIEQALSNLISNACKFSKKDTVVTIKTTIKNEWIKISVIDKGIGIAAEFYDKIFQKFSQADSTDTRDYEGSGLGLAISREIIDKMNGHIGFESEQGMGSEFFIELPLYK